MREMKIIYFFVENTNFEHLKNFNYLQKSKWTTWRAENHVTNHMLVARMCDVKGGVVKNVVVSRKENIIMYDPLCVKSISTFNA